MAAIVFYKSSGVYKASLTDIFLFYLQQKRKLRIFISNTFYPAKAEGEDGDESVPSWELRVEGRLLEDVSQMFIVRQNASRDMDTHNKEGE